MDVSILNKCQLALVEDRMKKTFTKTSRGGLKNCQLTVERIKYSFNKVTK